nr:unnamed protein product [Spirometra erinaceieuropaei]
MHAWFTWLLRLAGRNWTLYPVAQGPLCEDQQVEAEHRQGQDDLLLSTPVTGGLFAAAGDQQPQQHLHRGDSASALFSSTSAANGSAATSLVSPLNLAIGQSLGWSDGSLEGEIDLQFRLLTRLFKCVGEDVFSRIVHHVAVGNQVIVLPLEDARLGSLTTAALARFLPRGCVHMVIDSPEYVPAFYCNLLSLTPDAFVSCGPGPPDPTYMLLQVSVYSPALAHPRPGHVFGDPEPDSSEGSTESDADIVLKSGPTLVNDEMTKRCASVLATLQCSAPEDELIVRFWQKGLSQKTRQNVCHTHRSVHSSRRASGSSSTIGTNDTPFAINALDTLHF